MRYVDTSVLVSLLTIETHSNLAVQWMARQPAGSLAGSAWLQVEFSSALARKVSAKRLSHEQRNAILAQFTTAILPTLTLIPMDSGHFQRATDICNADQSSIRAGDALHLGVAASTGATVATLDNAFAAGAASLGYAVELIA